MAKKYDPLKSNRSSYFAGKPRRVSWHDQRSLSGPRKYNGSSYKVKAYRPATTRPRKSSTANKNSSSGKGFGYAVLFLLAIGFWPITILILAILLFIKFKPKFANKGNNRKNLEDQ